MKNILLLSILILVSSCKEDSTKAKLIEPVSNLNSKEVLLIGTLHYNNPGADVAKTKSFDILNDKSQAELQEISSSIKKYNPTKIFVEWPYDEQRELDSLYQLYIQDKYFKNKELSSFYLKNEIFQLAFRVARDNNLKKVYAIDYSTPFHFEQVMNDIEKNNQSQLKAEIQNGFSNITSEIDDRIESGLSLKELTYFINSQKFREISNNWHNNLMLLAGGPNDFSGPELTSAWFKRNLYMWSLIQKNTMESDDRIMVLIGGSHAAMIDLFVRDNKNWKVEELKDIMKK
tara:strand:- start:4575 stop:5438 length:864 start_codon:yes stop_codon:yes gene_type:complete